MKILLFFFLSSVFTMELFSLGDNIYLLRILTPISFFAVLINYFLSVFYFKTKSKMSFLSKILIAYFVYYFFHTSIVSAFQYFGNDVLSSEFNDIVNFIFLFFLCLTIVVFSEKKYFLKTVKKVNVVFYFLYLLTRMV